MKLTRLLTATALAGAALSALPGTAFAQAVPAGTPEGEQQTDAGNAPADGSTESQDGDTVLVTGSRIPRPEFEGVLPGVQVDAQQIATRGFTNALEVVNDIPLVGPGASPLNGNNGGQSASLGAAFIDLLDLGTQRTLTLVNGRRYVSGNAASLFVESNASGSQVDVNTIPAQLIARVDVLTVGGAAAYGSDAIAGVVNYILRDDYEGSEVRGLAGVTSRGDAGQYTLSAIAGRNFLDDRLNVTVAAEYNRIDGVQADARDFRLRRASTLNNPFNGATRNPAFGSAIIDVNGANNGAFLRASDDNVFATATFEGLVNQSLSFNGTILNTLATPAAPYTPNAAGFIALQNGVGSTATSFVNTAGQLINGLPGVPFAVLGVSGNGLNGAATSPVPITTFAPTALPAGITPAQVFAQFGITPPATATGAQQTALAVNVLQANRFTAREFFAANPNLPTNYFLGTFVPSIPRVANTDTTLVSVRTGANTTAQVPVNQVLPFVAIPLEFNADGSIRNYTAATLTPTTPGTFGQAPGSNGGFNRSIENIVLRTQQDRFITNLLAKFEVTPEVTLFTENLFSRVRNVSLRNSSSQQFLSTGAENAALVLNVNNPFLDAQDRAALASAGITPAVRGGSFVLTRQNQDIFGDNPFVNTSETYRLVGGARSTFDLFGNSWNAEISGTYGHARQVTQTTNIKDIEYQLAIDAVDQGLAVTGVPNGNIVCRSQLFPGQYLGRTPTGTVSNLTRLRGADGLPTETVITPTITADMIARCAPLNPFGYNNMSDAAKAYVRADSFFFNTSKQTFIQATLGGSVIDLPGGPLGVSFAGEYRKEQLDFSADSFNNLGRTRTAPSAATRGEIEVYEVGAEARIPIFGEDFLPFLGTLEFSPAIRISQQSGRSASFRNLAGQVITPTSEGDPETIYTLAGSWQPIPDITLRGNYTRSIRQPGVVELFLGGQPAFAAPTDPCGPTQINSGSNAANRVANCRAAVIAAGFATDPTSADTFLANFVANTASLPGSFVGAPGLQPEKGKSYTFGGVVAPRFVPGLTLSADYISLDLENIILPLTLADALAFCYDSATFPDTSPQTGANTCTNFTRGGPGAAAAQQFQVQPGFGSGYINLSATELRAINISGRYAFDLPGTLGRFSIRGNAYHLIRYSESSAGDFSDTVESAGTFNRPQWEAQLSGRLETQGGLYSQLTWNWRDRTRLFTGSGTTLGGGVPATIENFPNVVFPRISTFDFVLGADINDNFRIQANVINLTDRNFAGDLGLATAAFIDQVGRRFQVSTNIKF